MAYKRYKYNGLQQAKSSQCLVKYPEKNKYLCLK